MKNKTIVLTFTFLTLLIGCSEVPKTGNSGTEGSNSQSTTEKMPDNSANSLDWKGNYQGIIPCADCEGIETSITLNEDMTYLIKTKYLGKDEQVFEQKGTFTWNNEGNTIFLNDITGSPNQYLVGENMLIQLDNEGKRITGNLSDRYILKKITISGEETADTALLETYWKLTELRGKPVENLPEQQQQPYLRLKTENNNLEGFGGCNYFSGNYEVKEGNRLTFSRMISTKKACLNMETESIFFKTLETVDNYTINGRILRLNKAKMTPLVKFEAVDNK